MLLQFLGADRADPKRFEMLSLLAGVLNWGDAERTKAGLLRGGAGTPSKGGLLWGKSAPKEELGESDETEVSLRSLNHL